MKKVLALVLFALVASCGSSTHVTASFLNPKVSPQEREHLFILGITDRMTVRQSVEAAMAAEANKRGLKATKSIDVFPANLIKGTEQEQLARKEVLMELIKKSGADLVMTIALVDEQSETRYVQGSGSYAPMSYGFYGGYYPYYSARGAYMYQPGYYTEDKKYFYETNLYDVNTQELIWSAQSTTVNPSNLEKVTKEYTVAIISRMKKDGLIAE